jgi:hypothetical protein
MAEKTIFDQLNTNVDSYETRVLNATTVYSFQATGPNGEIIFDSTQQTLPGFIADTASLAFTASTAPLYLPLAGGTITGNLTVTGTTTLNNVVSVTSSYSSGSTVFGDTISDTHRFTGSVFITGSSVTWNNSTLIASNVTSSMSVASASQALTASYFNGSVTSASYAATASFLSGIATSASYAFTASYIRTAVSASYASTASLALNVSASSIDSNTSETYDGSNNISINWGSRRLSDSIGNGILNWEDKQLIDTNTVVSIDWNNRDLYDDLNALAMRYTTRREMYDTTENISLDWGDRFLIDSGGTTSINYENRWAISHDGNIGIDYENRQLLANDGGTVALDWSTPNANIMSGSLTVGRITSTPSNENTLKIYPAPAGGTGEGGQILLAASGGLYSSASMLDTWQNYFRVLRGTNTGGSNAQLLGLDLQTGNLSIAGALIPSAWTAGQVIKDTMLSNTEVTVSTTTIATSGTDTDFVTYSYTPVSSNSYLIIHYHLASYDFSGGTGNDSYISRIKVDGSEITYGTQSTVNGNRTGVLFPLTGRYTNSNTTAKSIVVACRRNSADDSITIVNSSTSMWLRITEIAR